MKLIQALPTQYPSQKQNFSSLASQQKRFLTLNSASTPKFGGAGGLFGGLFVALIVAIVGENLEKANTLLTSCQMLTNPVQAQQLFSEGVPDKYLKECRMEVEASLENAIESRLEDEANAEAKRIKELASIDE